MSNSKGGPQAERLHLSPVDHWDWQIPLKHSHGSRAGRLMFVGGQCDLDSTGNVLNPGRLDLQTDAALSHLARVLEALEGREQDVVKLNVFYRGGSVADEEALLRRVRAHLFGDIPPVISVLPLPRLAYPGLAVTIDAVAVDNSDGGAPRMVAVPSSHWGWPKGAEFSHGIRCGEFIFVGAQMARDGSGAIRHGEDIVSQARLTVDNLTRVLGEMGADLDDVVKLNTWYRGYGTDSDWRKAAQIRSDAFRYPGPGATGVPVPLIYPDGGLIRQECWAMRGLHGQRLPRSLSWPVGHWDWPMRVSFQQGVKVGKHVFLGGQVALDSRGQTVCSGDMAAQTRVIMDFIKQILAGFEAKLDDLVKVTCFYKSAGAAETLHEILAIRSSYFAEHVPATTSVPLEALGFEGVMLEVEGIAILDR